MAKIKRFIFMIFVLVLIVYSNCSSLFRKLRAINLHWTIPIVDKNQDAIFKEIGNSKLYFYGDIILYEKEGVFINAEEKPEKMFTYWIYKKNSQQGIRYESIDQDCIGTSFEVDSFLVKNAFKTFPFFDKENDVIVSKEENIEKETLIEKYISKIKPDDSYPDTTVFKYDKTYIDIPFSFSTEIEAKSNSKLVEICSYYNPIPNSKYKSQLEGRKMLFQIKKIAIENQYDILQHIDLFIKDSKRLNLDL